MARNWVISLNLGLQIQSCLFWLKTSIHGVLEVLIANPNLDFWNCSLKIHLWANLCQESQSCPFCLKIDIHSISRMQNHVLIFFFSEFSTLNPFLGKFRPKKSKLFVLPENWHTEYLEDVDSYSELVFWSSKPKSMFWANLSRKSRIVYFAWELTQSISKMWLQGYWGRFESNDKNE